LPPSIVVAFHGVRGSYPVSGERFQEFGGSTACVEVRAGGHLIICDAGTGIIGLGNRLAGSDGPTPWLRPADGARRGRELILLISHAHYDHIQGLPFFKPAFIPGFSLRVFGPRLLGSAFERVLSRSIRAPLFPVDLDEMGARRTIRTLVANESIRLPGKEGAPSVTIRTCRNTSHPRGGVANYRIECGGRSVVYATDVEPAGRSASRLARFASGASLLIHDAQYLPEEYDGAAPGEESTRGWGHSTWPMAARIADQAAARALALFHHDPSHDDAALREIERRTRQMRGSGGRVFAARQGQRVIL
jgi:phosphoribosyl 1,2-cyclic phosphodiesterase